MKKTTAALLVMGLVGSTNLFANSVCNSKYGMMNCGKGTITSINFTGLVNIDGTTVTNSFDVMGNLEIVDSNITNMHVKGESYIEDTEIHGYLDIKGNVHSASVKIFGITNIVGNWFGQKITFSAPTSIIGVTNCNDCRFNDTTTFVGTVNLKNSRFLTSITINTRNSRFERTFFKDIFVAKNNDNNPAQSITLANNSIVSNVTFESGDGTILIDKTSKILGKVIGGKIIRQ